MRLRLLLIVSYANILLQTSRAQIGSSCFTHNKESGTCIYIRKCNSIWKVMTEAPRPLPDRIVEYIKGSQCGNAQDKTICCRDQDVNGGSTTTETPNIYRDHETQDHYNDRDRLRRTTTTTRAPDVYRQYNSERENDRRYETSDFSIDSGVLPSSTTSRTTTKRRTTTNIYYPTNNIDDDRYYTTSSGYNVNNNQYNSSNVGSQTARRTTTTTTRALYDSDFGVKRNPSSNTDIYRDQNYNTHRTTTRNLNDYTTESSNFNNLGGSLKNNSIHIIRTENSFEVRTERTRQDRGYDLDNSNSGNRGVNSFNSGGTTTTGNKREINLDIDGVNVVTQHQNLNLLNLRTCGPVSIDRQRIANGNKTDLFEFPWMALLGYESEIGELDFKCGGTLISKSTDITYIT